MTAFCCCCGVVSEDLMNEVVALNEAAAQQDVDSSADSKDKQRSVSPVTNNINVSTPTISFDAQPVNFYLRIGAIG